MMCGWGNHEPYPVEKYLCLKPSPPQTRRQWSFGLDGCLLRCKDLEMYSVTATVRAATCSYRGRSIPSILLVKGLVWTHKMLSAFHLENTECQSFAWVTHPIGWRGNSSCFPHLQCPDEECAAGCESSKTPVLVRTPSSWDSHGWAGAWEWDVTGKIQTTVFPEGPS